jgi:hypothetical protein
VQRIRHFLLHEPAIDEFAGNVLRQVAPLVERQMRTEQPIERSRVGRHHRNCTIAGERLSLGRAARVTRSGPPTFS